jgi:hypothetical protein
VTGQVDHFSKIDANGERQMEETARCGAYGLGVVDIDGVAAHQDRIRAKRVGTSDHRAEIAWIPDLITKHCEPTSACQRVGR